MTKQINWTYNVAVVGGPKFSNSNAISADAVDDITVEIEPKKTQTVEVQPGVNAGQVQFLLISSDPYDDKVTFKVNATDPARVLNGPHVLIGSGAAQLLATPTTDTPPKFTPPQKLSITNGLANDPISVSILVGRDATP